jgi:hypothetical protein
MGIAYAHVQYEDGVQELTFTDTHHFLAFQYELTMGMDQFYPSYSGAIVNLIFSIGDGAF